jgi:transcriptional repressor NrdR
LPFVFCLFKLNLNCPYCGSFDSAVLESRDSEDGAVIRRRRECVKCSKRFTTYERIENIDLRVVKKDGRKENFDREKVKKGIEKACEKRPVDPETIERIVDDLEMRLLNRKSTEVSSSDIGRMVLTRLKKIDKVAYLRFASVFLEFGSVEEFRKEIREIT